MGIAITVAIILSFVALATFVRARGLRDKIPVDHDPARGDPARAQGVANTALVAAVIGWSIAFILS